VRKLNYLEKKHIALARIGCANNALSLNKLLNICFLGEFSGIHPPRCSWPTGTYSTFLGKNMRNRQAGEGTEAV